MKIAVVYNSPEASVLQHRGHTSQEIYPTHNIDHIVMALQENDHEVVALEADRYLIDRLEKFFRPIHDDEWPGLVFNLAFGIQGQLRYTHVPGILEMLGLPYLGSGPLGHTLASDKAAAKALFRHRGLATPDFALLLSEEFDDPGLGYPLVAKPVAGASSLGMQLVENEQQLRAAVQQNLEEFAEPVLAERFIDGREISISIMGNEPAQALPPVEVTVSDTGPFLYSSEDKDGTAKRELKLLCPTDIPDTVARQAEAMALKAFAVLGCRDWARVEFRLDRKGQLYLLELNTIPGLGRKSSLPAAAAVVGTLELSSLVQQLVDVATARYEL